MKKLACMLLALAMMLSLAACGGNGGNNAANNGGTDNQTNNQTNNQQGEDTDTGRAAQGGTDVHAADDPACGPQHPGRCGSSEGRNGPGCQHCRLH